MYKPDNKICYGDPGDPKSILNARKFGLGAARPDRTDPGAGPGSGGGFLCISFGDLPPGGGCVSCCCAGPGAANAIEEDIIL